MTINLAGGLVSLTGGNLQLAQVSTATQSWVAAAGDHLTLAGTAGPLTFSGNFGFLYNTGPAGHEISDWSFTGLSDFSSPLAADLVEVTGSNVTVNLSSALSVSVDTFTLTTQTVADDTTITLAGTPTHPTGVVNQLTVGLSGLTINLAGGLVSLTGGNLQLAQVSTATQSWVAAAGDHLTLAGTAGPLTFSGNFGFLYNTGPAGHEISDWSFTGLSDFSSSLAADLVEVTGSNVTVNLSSALSVSVDTFTLTTQTVADDTSITLAGTPTHPTGAVNQLTVGLSGLTINLAGGLVSLTGGNLQLAQVSTATQSWVAAAGDHLTLAGTAGPLTFSGNFGFLYNTGPAGHEISDWSFTGLSDFTSPLAADLVEVTGSNVTVNLSSALSVTVDTFALTTQTVADDTTITLAGTPTHPTGVVNELTFGLTGLTINLAGGLVSLTGGNLQLAQVSTATQSWVAAAGDHLTLAGTAGPLTFSGNFGFLFNTGPAGHEISDWSFTGLSDFTSPLAADLVEVTGSNVTVNLSSALSVSVDTFTLTTQTVADDTAITLAGTPTHPTGTVNELTFGLSGLTINLAGGLVSLTGGHLQLAQVSTATQSWVAAAGDHLQLAVTAGPLTFSGDFGFLFNTGPAGHEISDWSFTGLSDFSSPLAADLVEVTGSNVTVDLSSALSVSVDTFTLTTKTVADDTTITLAGTPTHPTGTVTQLTFGLSGLTINLAGGLVSLTG